MKYCGIELKGNEAIIVSIRTTAEGYEILSPRIKKIKINDPGNQSDILSFAGDIRNYLSNHDFDRIGIKGRQTKGKFAGGPVSFKMEGIIQTMNYPVEIIQAYTLKAGLKGKEIDTSSFNIYQIEALKVALYLLYGESV